MRRWEYHYLSANNRPIMVQALDELGKQGWELISLNYDGAIFKRDMGEVENDRQSS